MAPKILIVEDAANLRRQVSYNLGRAGYEVLEAEDGKAAVRVLQRVVPDLVILDIRMPEMDGFALLELMRRYPSAASIPVIMLTALSSAADLDRALQLGVVDYLVKPVDPAPLLNKVASALRGAPGTPTAGQSAGQSPEAGPGASPDDKNPDWRGPNRRQFVRGSIAGVSLDPLPGGTGVNIGEGGLSWLSRRPPAFGAVVALEAPAFAAALALGAAEPALRARVVFLLDLNDGWHRVGATFIGLPEVARNAIRRYVLDKQTRFVKAD